MLSLLFAAMARVSARRVGEFNSEEVANISWAFATVKCREETLFAVLATAAHRRLSMCKPQGLAKAAWAFAAVK